jgi:hypothetical protein
MKGGILTLPTGLDYTVRTLIRQITELTVSRMTCQKYPRDSIPQNQNKQSKTN